MKTLLLHICCAPCATAVIEKLFREYDLTLYFYNPNIMPLAEYRKRLEEARILAEKLDLQFIEGDHDVFLWSELIEGYEKEPEKGKRCEICFKMRLKEIFYNMKDKGFDLFATTLTISPHKESETINRIGKEISKDRFLALDFKNLYNRSAELCQKHGIYKQNYCGCIYSMRK